MRYSVITESAPQAVTDEKGAGIYVKVPALFARMLKAGWIAPVTDKPKVKLFRYSDLDKCIDRLAAGEWPEE